MFLFKLMPFALLVIFKHELCRCDTENFQANVDDFINAFDNVFPTEVNTDTTDEIYVGNEIPTVATLLGQESLETQNEEEVVVREAVFHPGSDVKHELTEQVQLMAENAVMNISPQLKLVNVTEAISVVTDKVQRSLSLVVAQKTCEDTSCTISCRVELISQNNVDEVTWHNCLDTPGVNEVTRSKRGAVGGFKQVDETEAKELAYIAVQTLDSIDADDTKRVVTQVLRAQKQLVNGIMYHLTLEVASSDCREANEKCEGKLNDYNICKVLMQRLFSGEAPRNAQVIKSECTPVTKGIDANNKKRVRRHVNVDKSEGNMITNDVLTKHSYSRMVGGRTKQDPKSDKIKEISEFALLQIDKSSNSLNKQKIVRVIDARTQVVAGLKYYLKMELVETNCRKDSSQEECIPVNDQVLQSCDVVVWDKPWEKFRAVLKIECVPVQHRIKRALGGRKPADPNDAKIQEIAQFAVSQLSAKSNSLNSHKLVIVKQAETQVVSGIKYFLKLQLVETNCRKESEVSSACNSDTSKVLQECDVVVWDQPWEKHRELLSDNCIVVSDTKHLHKRDAVLVGGQTPQDKDSDYIKQMAQFAVEDLNKKSNSIYKQTLTEVISATTQVVSGLNYHLKLRIAESDCKKSNAVESVLCTPKVNAVHQECNIIVWHQAWLNKSEVTKSFCKPIQDMQAAGGPKVVDPLAPEVLEAAKFSLRTIDKGSNSMYKHALIRVLDARVQTVSGKKYFLTIEIGESECTKKHDKENCAVRTDNMLSDTCSVVVWDQPWLGKKEVLDVKCGYRSKRASTNILSDKNDIHINMFEEFKVKFNKVYMDEVEHKKRFRIFRANLKKIETFQNNEQGNAVYGPNMFADLTAKEFKEKYLGLKPGNGPKPSNHHMVPAQIPDIKIPTNFDWRDHNAVTPVKNQGQCGSCWAFSVTGNVEGQWFLKHGKLLSLSEQELVDCDKTDDGCNGGYMTNAYEAIEKLGGLETEDQYPYDAEDETCKFNQSEVQATVTSSVNITTNETQIAQWLFANGPISVGINANAMQFYMGGVSHPFKFLCSKDELDHGVLLVGFGVHKTSIRHKFLPYWLIKNSWGPHWGEKGYYRLYRGDGTCGVNQMASSAIVG